MKIKFNWNALTKKAEKALEDKYKDNENGESNRTMQLVLDNSF